MTLGRRLAWLLGELLLTGAALVGLFLVWKLWWYDGITAAHQQSSATSRLQTWSALRPVEQTPRVAGPASPGAAIGVLRVPRFGTAYARTIAQGTGTAELSSFEFGVGHYTGTAMPGGVGNFAVAGHRSAYGGAMHLLDRLRPGDQIEVDTPLGRYVYRFTSIRTVQPTAVSVLLPVPDRPGLRPTKRLITLTTCTPLYSTAMRLVAVGELASFTPRSTP